MEQAAPYNGPVPTALQSTFGKRVPPLVATLTLAGVYLLAWLFRRTYAALDDDAQLYAFQALATLKPLLREHDLFLAYGSQDQYTLFSPLYALAIQTLGLPAAEALLNLIFHAWALTAAWHIARRFSNPQLAWLAVGIVIMVPGYYGARWVFEYAEPFLTARLPAEALVLTSIALFLADKKWLSWLCALLAVAMHPIIAAPGIALLLLLSVPATLRVYLVILGTAIISLVATAAATNTLPAKFLMDADWLAVVRARSSFMFVETWESRDWDWALLTLLTLAFCWKASTSSRIRVLYSSAAVIGVAGLVLTAICSLAPLQIVLQGQPWRWMWLGTYLAVLTAAPNLFDCWKRGQISKYSCTLLYASWVFPISWALPGMIAAPIAAVALVLFWFQDRIPVVYRRYCTLLSVCVCVVAAATVLISTVLLLQLSFTTNREHIAMERTRDILALGIPGIALVVGAWSLTIRQRLAIPIFVLAAGVAVVLVRTAPQTYNRWVSSAYVDSYDSFAVWRGSLDHQRSVFWAGNAVGPWLLLDSPSYLTISQSAGVVFSRETALEVGRRATNLAPLTGHPLYAIVRTETRSTEALTVPILRQICSDPLLGYVVSGDDLPIAHLAAPRGRWAGLNLYNCDTARDAKS